MVTLFKNNESVQWKWLGRIISGKVKEIYFEPTEKVIKNKRIKRNGSKMNPAYLVQSKAGNLALKLHTELSFQVEEVNHKGPRPTLFGDM